MKAEKLTIRQIKATLFNNPSLYAVIGADEMTNQEARKFFFTIENQDSILNVIDNDTHILIY